MGAVSAALETFGAVNHFPSVTHCNLYNHDMSRSIFLLHRRWGESRDIHWQELQGYGSQLL